MICLFEENNCSPALLKVPVYFTELVAVIFSEKYCVKCPKVPAATQFFVGECANLQFHNSNCSYSFSIVKFLKEQL